jgi:hypothetical protein
MKIQVSNDDNYVVYYYYYYYEVRLSPLGTAASIGLLYQPQAIDDGDCGPLRGMKIGRGNRSTRRNLAPVPLCPPQIPRDPTRAAAVGSQRLTARQFTWYLKPCSLVGGYPEDGSGLNFSNPP